MKTIRVENISNRPNDFVSTDLNVGEMMEIVHETKLHVVLRTFSKFVSLTNPDDTWGTHTKLLGRKLLPGEGITLIQE
jgi:hypothetical protein